MLKRQFPCEQCGANLTYLPGTDVLSCSYCGHQNKIELKSPDLEERDYRTFLRAHSPATEPYEVMVVRCSSCGAESSLPPNVVADQCPFCGNSIVQTTKTKKVVLPQGILPFQVQQAAAEAAFSRWLGRLWFAPNALKKSVRKEGRLRGMYIPYWTYDARTFSQYQGQRGDHYYTTETYTTRENGRAVTRTRQVRHTRWRSASGRVNLPFDDVLIVASTSLPTSQIRQLGPWDLRRLVGYNDEYLSGFQAESYTISLQQGFHQAQQIMDAAIRNAIKRDIGGDEQRILHKDTQYENITFKHLLLPIWMNAYRYHDRTFRFIVNGQTGEVQGERPWSAIKIALTVLAAAAVIAVIVFIAQQSS